MGRTPRNVARITLKCGSKRMANALFRALEPEAKAAPTGRSRIGISRKGNDVKIAILSRDLSSLRAAINTYLRLASACQGLLEALKGLGEGPSPLLDSRAQSALPDGSKDRAGKLNRP